MKFKVLCLLFLAMTSGNYAQTKKAAPKSKVTTKTTTVTKKSTSTKPASDNGLFAEFETSKGKIVVMLEYKKAPITVANFVSLAEGSNPFVAAEYKDKPFYNGLKFHRVIADFMIQGGDPLGTGSGDPGYKFKDEFNEDKFDGPGILAMANSGPATNGSQFFITHKDTPWLNGKHTIFGHVVSGQNVVNAIAQNDVINKVVIIRKGSEAKSFKATQIFTDYFGKEKKEAADAIAKSAGAKAAKVAELAKIKATSTTTESGLTYKIIKQGDGKKPADGTQVYIHYAGYFEDGSLFESSYESVNRDYGKFNQQRASQNGYQPFPFEYGKKSGLIDGFLEGLKYMSYGDKIVLFIPSNLGYKAAGSGLIPPNTNLVFEMEMLETMPGK